MKKITNEAGNHTCNCFLMEMKLSYGIEKEKMWRRPIFPTSISLFTFCFSIFFPFYFLCFLPSFQLLLHLVSLQLHIHPSSYHHISCTLHFFLHRGLLQLLHWGGSFGHCTKPLCYIAQHISLFKWIDYNIVDLSIN